MPQSELKFVECEDCVNLHYDPFQCKSCRKGNKFDSGGDIEQELTYHEFLDFVRGIDQ